MKRNQLIAFFLAGFVLLLAVGCQGQATTLASPAKKAESPVVDKHSPEAESILVEAVSVAKMSPPRIVFDEMVHDFGEVGPGTKNTCEFKFTNAGGTLLKIGKVKSTCGCAITSLSKKEYAPGESGILTVTYTASTRRGSASKSIYVPSDDKAKPKVKLTIKAKIVEQIEVKPERLQLSLRKENAGLANITIKSKDGKPFSIAGFKSTHNNSIVADFDPAEKASEFILRPRADVEKLKAGSVGRIEIQLDHPKCPVVRVHYQIEAEFKVIPRTIAISGARAQEPITKEVVVSSNYGEDFEIESVSSKNGYIKVLSQKKIEHGFKFEVQVTPPAVGRLGFFSDTLHVGINGREPLPISCYGYYEKSLIGSKELQKTPVEFVAEPQMVKVYNVEPQEPVTREVWVSSRSGKDFEIESTSSHKGTVELLGQEKVGSRYKLRLKITPPPTKLRLKIFSDTFYVNIKSGENNKETTKLSVSCRGSYSRRAKQN